MNTPIITINGITRSADHTVNRMGIVLGGRGHRVEHLTYPTRWWWETRSRRKQYLDALGMLRELQDRFPQGRVDVVAHSWGNLLAVRMMELGGSNIFRRVFAFAPAIDQDWIFPLKAFERMWVIFNRGDRSIWAAEHLFLGQHPWGNMGRVGYVGEDPRVQNVEDDAKRKNATDRLHSHYFENAHLERWSTFVSQRNLDPGDIG